MGESKKVMQYPNMYGFGMIGFLIPVAHENGPGK